MKKSKIHSKNEITEFQPLDGNYNSIYISAPITSGTNFLEWYITRGCLIENSNDYKKAHYNEIVQLNSEKILRFHAELSRKYTTPIIEPASLKMPGWSQNDYLNHWEEVINRCVTKIIFMDGWCFSKGCTFEYYIGLKKGIELVDQNEIAIDPQWALTHIQQAIAEYSKAGINTNLQQKLVKKIEYECRK